MVKPTPMPPLNRFFTAVLATVALLSTPAATEARPSVPAVVSVDAQLAQAIERVKPASVAVNDNAGTFSAVIVSPQGLVLTAGHCIDPGATYEVVLPDGRKYAATGLGKEPTIDMGMMRITETISEPLPWVELGRSGELEPGEVAFGVSYPGAADLGNGPIVRVGRVVTRKAKNGFLQSTVAMEPGDSGGPLFDGNGRLIGIHSQIEVPLDRNYDVPIDHFIRDWDRLLKGERYSRWRESTENLGFELETTDSGAIQVVSVSTKTPAERAGLQAGDTLVEVSGRTIDRKSRVRRAFRLAARKSEKRVSLLVDRSGVSIGLLYQFNFESIASSAPPTFSPPGIMLPKVDSQDSDFSVVVKSEKSGQEVTVAGTVLSDSSGAKEAGCLYVLSKSSRIGDRSIIVSRSDRSAVATIVRRDPQNDLALLRIEPVDWPAIPIDRFSTPTVGRLVRYTRETGDTQIGVIGAAPTLVRADLVLGVQISETSLPSIEVTRVFPSSPAEHAGVEVGDVIEAIEGRRLEKRADLTGTLSGLGAPREISLQIKRGSQPLILRVTPEPRGAEAQGMSFHAADSVPGGLSKRRMGFDRAVPVDARLTPAECGTMLFNPEGVPVGMVVARRSRTQCLALPSDVIQTFFTQATRARRAQF